MLQAGVDRAFGFGLLLSGVTPGECDKQGIRRVSLTALHAALLTQGRTRWRIPPPCVVRDSLLSTLAGAFQAGGSAADRVAARAAHVLGRTWPFMEGVARRYAASIAGGTRPRRAEVVQFLLRDPVFKRHAHRLSLANRLTGPEQMQPAAVAANWRIPSIESAGALAEWLGLSAGDLLWFADLKGISHRSERLSHYRYRVLAKRSGAVRLIEAPKPRLKQLQRKILTAILDRIPPHPAVHGFVRARSIKTFVEPHTGRRVVLRMDLQNFFPTFAAARIRTLFRTMGYPESFSDLLGGLCTNAAHLHGLGFEARALYRRPHLPQGAPTSPALANLCFYRIDCRLAALARSAGAAYTRYADDLAFSGDAEFEPRAERFSAHVAALLLEEGFPVNYHKTRVMRQGVCQRLAGLAANQRVNIVRVDFDRLKAILANCVRHGPHSQNREHHPQFRAHLEGRVSFVESINPDKAKRLRELFDRIRWSENP
jgi:RNA-directed DNA polymerase